jgi:hypothetical protein
MEKILRLGQLFQKTQPETDRLLCLESIEASRSKSGVCVVQVRYIMINAIWKILRLGLGVLQPADPREYKYSS